MALGLEFKDFIKKYHPEMPKARQHVRQYSCALSCHYEGATHVDMSANIRRAAFTLAEVLITLGIIGIVAAMTIPTLIANYQEKQTVSRLTKAYATISNAYQMAKVENGDFSSWGFKEISDAGASNPETGNWEIGDSAVENSNLFWAKLTPYMKVVHHTDTTKDNFQFDTYTLDGRKSGMLTMSTVELADGTAFFGGWVATTNCTDSAVICADFAIDINGINTKPNTYGKDIFYFILTKNGIKPQGRDYRSFDDGFCTMEGWVDNKNGYGCAAWVLENKNMDYLHCNDLSWDGKHKCD